MGFEIVGVTVDESNGDLVVGVSVLQNIAKTVSVDVEVINGTATEGQGQFFGMLHCTLGVMRCNLVNFIIVKLLKINTVQLHKLS